MLQLSLASAAARSDHSQYFVGCVRSICKRATVHYDAQYVAIGVGSDIEMVRLQTLVSVIIVQLFSNTL